MIRTPVNPTSFSIQLGFNQAELVEGHRRELICSMQDAVDADGSAQHPGDMKAQLQMSLGNLEALLTEAGMTLGNVVRLNFYTTNMGALLENFSVVNKRFSSTDARFATSLLGVTALPAPDLLVGIEATAMD